MEQIRQPIVSVLGHVDHGKSSILDNIRGSAITETEAGRITQAIGASIIPLKIIKKISGKLLDNLKMDLTISGLLFIDTPGHEIFTNLRKRGGNLADIAILVVDINEGFKPQTIEAVEILKTYKTPFVVAANKIDLIAGWDNKDKFILQSLQKQSENVKNDFEKKLYELVGKLHELGFQSERFDRVEDYSKQIAIVPTSAINGEGIPELLMIITGLAHKFLEKCLKCDVNALAKGTILEVKETRGLGTTVDVIVYDGTIKVNDTIVIGGIDEPIVTKVRALLEPKPLKEMRDKKAKFDHVKQVFAATGVKISAPNIKNVVAGMPIRVANKDNLEKIKKEIQQEVDEVLIETDNVGLIIKADTLGSLEALSSILRNKDIPIQKASIGNITKKDITEAESNYEKNQLFSTIIGFNVVDESGMKNERVKIINSDIIYTLTDEFEKHKQDLQKQEEMKVFENLTMPCKLRVIPGYVFRQSNPAVFGVDVIYGILKTGSPIMNDQGKFLGYVKQIQHEQKNINKIEQGKQVAISVEKIMVGRHLFENDTLYSSVSEQDFRKFKEYKHLLKKSEKLVLKEIAEIMRRKNSVWGV